MSSGAYGGDRTYTSSGDATYGANRASGGYERSDTRTSRGDTYEGNEERRTSSTSTSHGSLSERVKKALSRNDRTRSLDVNVEAHKGGVVTLTGNVHREKQKRQAGEIARTVEGVKRVRNDIQVGQTSSSEHR